MKRYNHRGKIASTYDELTSLRKLLVSPITGTTAELRLGTTRALFRAVELGLVAIEDLVLRGIEDLRGANLGRSSQRLMWAHAFAKLIQRISFTYHELAPALNIQHSVHGISQSNSHARVVEALLTFDKSFSDTIQQQGITTENLIGNHTLDYPLRQLFQTFILLVEATRTWEENMSHADLGPSNKDYGKLLSLDMLKSATEDHQLTGDTYFLQFRIVHQISEVLCQQANTLIEETITQVHREDWRKACITLRFANRLVSGLVDAIMPLVERLTTSDYHEFRENVGTTSGSQSTAIRQELFQKNYRRLWETIQRQNGSQEKQATSGSTVPEVVLDVFVGELCGLHTAFEAWRNYHLILVRTNLGLGTTKSMISATDATSLVERMRDSSQRVDPIAVFLSNCGLSIGSDKSRSSTAIQALISDRQSFYKQALITTGEITSKRFQHLSS